MSRTTGARGEPATFYTRHRPVDDDVVVELGGEFDAGSLDELTRVLGEVLATEPREIVVDLAETTFVDSMTLGALTAAAKQVRAGGGSFRIVRARAPEVRRAFEVTGLAGYLFDPAASSTAP